LQGFETSDGDGYTYSLDISDFSLLRDRSRPSPTAFAGGNREGGFFIDVAKSIALQQDGNTLTFWCSPASPLSITFLLQFLLLSQRKTLVHAAAVSIGDRAFLFPAFGGVGKTALLGTLMRSGEVRLLGDDLVILSEDGYVEPYFRPFCLYPYHAAVFPEYFQGSRFVIAPASLPLRCARRLFCLAGGSRVFDSHVALGYMVVAPQVLFPEAQLERRAVRLEAVCLLERSQRCSSLKDYETTKPQIAQFLGNVMYHEWYENLRVLFAYNAHAQEAPWNYFARVGKIIESALKDVRTIRRLDIPASFGAAEAGAAITCYVRAELL
jgi:hypothetical protein